jgi:hypothetical protein
MAIDFSKTKLNVPAWVQEILDRWEGKTGYEVEIAEDIRRRHNAHQQIDAEDFKGYYAEWAAFPFFKHRKPQEHLEYARWPYDDFWRFCFAGLEGPR